MKTYSSIKHLFDELLFQYKDNSSRYDTFKFRWDASIVDVVEKISPDRCRKRIASYIIDDELERAAEMNSTTSAGASIRFGRLKTGRGFIGGRKDFCLIGGVYKNKVLTLFYRRLDLLGGLFYDTVLIREVERAIGPITSVVIMAVQVNIYARKGGSNEKLYKQLKAHFNANA